MTTMANQVPGEYPALSILNVTIPMSIPAGTTGKDIVVAATVPQGQYWMPKLVRISLQSSNPEITVGGVLTASQGSGLFTTGIDVPQFQLYQGGPVSNTIQPSPYLTPNQNLYLDGTLDGTADATGVVSGTLLQPQDTLIGVWRDVTSPMDLNGKALGAIATMQIIGLISNVPPSAPVFNPAWIPAISGVHFQGKPSNPTVMEATQVTELFFTAPGPGKDVHFLVGLPPAIKLWYMTWWWTGPEPTANQNSGTFQLRQGSTVVSVFNADTASVQAKHIDFHGAKFSLYGSGSSDMVFAEDPSSGMVANTLDCTGTLVYSTINPLP